MISASNEPSEFACHTHLATAARAAYSDALQWSMPASRKDGIQ